MPNRPSIPAEVEREVFLECGHRCAVCGTSLPLERAHIVPWHKTREHSVENLICLCANCHERADKEDWGQKTLKKYKERPWVLRNYEGPADAVKSRSRIQLVVDMDMEDFDKKSQRWLKHAVAGFLEISPASVKITSIEEDNSIRIILEIPEEEEEKLVRAYRGDRENFLSHLSPLTAVDVRIAPPRVKPMLTTVWTTVAMLLLYVSIVLFLRTRGLSLPFVGMDIRSVITADLAALVGVLLGLPLVFLLLYLTQQYQRGLRESGLTRRLPVAFNRSIDGHRFAGAPYQYISFMLFLLFPVVVQIHMLHSVLSATVYTSRSSTIFASGIEENLTEFVPLSVLYSDDYRYGSMDERESVAKSGGAVNVTYYPFWQSWFILVMEVGMIGTFLRVLRNLMGGSSR